MRLPRPDYFAHTPYTDAEAPAGCSGCEHLRHQRARYLEWAVIATIAAVLLLANIVAR